jgi:tRNA pseudouridine55 synthase
MKDGVIVIDKPSGMSSAFAVSRVKRAVSLKKIGHTGTLDPFATGLLICCVNRATKLAGFFIKSKKRYDAVLNLGIETDTQDVTGTVICKNAVPELSEMAIKDVFREFEGNILQIPPSYSALKHEGVPLYRLAREGNAIKKDARPVTIESIEVIGIELPYIEFSVCCSSGTYIRTLASDIGARLGCGAHLCKLRRIECGNFSINDAISLDNLNIMGKCAEDLIIPMTKALRNIPQIRANAIFEKKIRLGRPIYPNDIAPEVIDKHPERMIKITDNHDILLAVIWQSNENKRLEVIRFT